MRLFIAIEIPGDIKEYFSKIQGEIDNTTNKIKFVNKNQKR